MICRISGNSATIALQTCRLEKGLSGRVLDKNDKAANTHCNSHVLNLSIAATIRIDIIQTVLDKMTAVNIFFNFSPKREGLLEHIFTKNEPDNKKKTNLNRPL